MGANANNEQLENDDANVEENNEGVETNEGNDQGAAEGNNAGNVDEGKQGKTFTQEDVNRMMAREKNQGRNSVYKELGIDPNDKKSIALVKALVESQKADENAEQNAASNAELEEANRRALVAEAKAQAMMMGILPKYVEDAIALALPKVTEEKDLKTVIGELKSKYPVWVKEDDDDKGSSVGKKGTGSSIGSSDSKNGKDAKGIGARLAASRKNSKPKQSYWGNN